MLGHGDLLDMRFGLGSWGEVSLVPRGRGRFDHQMALFAPRGSAVGIGMAVSAVMSANNRILEHTTADQNDPLTSLLVILLMDKILHDLKDSKLWELWYIPYNG